MKPIGHDSCVATPTTKPVDLEPDQLITAQEAMKLLGISRNTLYALARRGELPGKKFGKSWRFHRAALLAGFKK